MNRGYPRSGTTITSGGNQNPATADLGGSHESGRGNAFTAQACLDLDDTHTKRAPRSYRRRPYAPALHHTGVLPTGGGPAFDTAGQS